MRFRIRTLLITVVCCLTAHFTQGWLGRRPESERFFGWQRRRSRRYWFHRRCSQAENKPLEARRSFPTEPIYGEVSEWLKVQPWKGCVRFTVPRVRIPPSPIVENDLLQTKRRFTQKAQSPVARGIVPFLPCLCYTAHHNSRPISGPMCGTSLTPLSTQRFWEG